MAKPKTNFVVEESKSDPNLLYVWLPDLAPAVFPIRGIEGVSNVFHSTSDRLDVYLNPCYDKSELMAEIKAVVSKFG